MSYQAITLFAIVALGFIPATATANVCEVNPSHFFCGSNDDYPIVIEGPVGPRGEPGADGVADAVKLQEISDNITANASRIEQVDNEDMRVKSGTVNNNTLTLRVEDQAKTQGRDFIYGVDVDIDVSSLDQSAGVSQNANAIATNTSSIATATQQVDSNTSSIATATQQVDSNTSAIATATQHVDSNKSDIATNKSSIATATQQVDSNKSAIADNEEMNTNTIRNKVINSNTTASNSNTISIDTNRQAIATANARIDSAMRDMRYLNKNLSAGIANAIAMGQHQFDPGYQGGQVSISGGHFNGANAVSLAVGVPAGENAFFSISAAANDGPGNESIGMGLTFRLPK